MVKTTLILLAFLHVSIGNTAVNKENIRMEKIKGECIFCLPTEMRLEICDALEDHLGRKLMSRYEIRNFVIKNSVVKYLYFEIDPQYNEGFGHLIEYSLIERKLISVESYSFDGER